MAMTTSSSLNYKGLVTNVFLERHSGKSYDPSQPVKMDIIKAVSEAASRAFTSYNLQPYKCIFCFRIFDSNDFKPYAIDTTPFNKALNSIFGNAPKTWVQKAPVLVLFVERTKYSQEDSLKNKYIKAGDVNPHHSFDTGAAAMCMALQATMLGLMAHPIGGFDHEKIRADFNLAPDEAPRILMTLGYEQVDPSEKRAERNPLQNNFFIGTFDNPLHLCDLCVKEMQ